MRLRSRPVQFARLFADAATSRPFLCDLLAQRRAGEPTKVQPASPEIVTEPAALPRAA
jgi:hypothetical protein